MVFLELAVQAARGFAASARAAFKPGYVVLKASGAEAPPWVGLSTALLFADGRGGDAQFLAPGQKSGKAGLTLLGNDQNTYRIVRELGGPGALHKFDRAAQKFTVVSEDVQEIGQFLRSQVGLPPKAAFEHLFTLTPAQLPTRRPKPKAKGAAPGSSGPKLALAGSAPVEAASDVGAAKTKIGQLEKELRLSKEIEQLQSRVDVLSSELFELENASKGNEGLRAALEEAEEAFQKAPTPESLGFPKDIISRCEHYPELVQKRDEALAKLGVNEAPEEPQEPAYVAPLQNDPRFWAGVGLGTALLGFALWSHGSGRYLALLDIPAYGFSALLALKHVEDLQATRRTSNKGGMRDAREKKIRDSFEAEAQHVRDAMKALNVESPTEVITALSQKPLYGEKVQELRAQLAQAEQDPAVRSTSQRIAQVKKEQEELNQKLLEKGGYVRSVGEVERDLERVKQSLALAQGGAKPAPAEPTFAAVASGPDEAFEDPCPALMTLGADLFTVDVPALGGLLKDRCAQYVAALTDRRYHAIEFGADGKATAVAPGRKIAAAQLPGKDLDLLYLALRLTLVEKYGAQGKMPLLIEDPFAALDEAKVPLIARMLKHLGTATQVLHLVKHPGFEGMADSSATL